ncbi:MAG: oxidoreductase [Candidatus Omnitrophica bacterium CG11_big_fil_rev_8_21_14_0_20_42_13]|uniref:Oxidoreductase n=1 Tax=Candidatus Ghiorseimicrobium undicola TaxID=1974746 RepID=A0A2H0LVW2_9BACT|nr:MAG: oxidoreductase [Candidatus Omnitrophica bacterium CG11_big_fil_rev_8_21_14_0_20_42_13]
MFQSESKEIISVSPYRAHPAEIVLIKDYTPLEKLFRLKLPEDVEFKYTPGQFAEISIFGVGEAPISICSSPTDKGYFEITVRNAGSLTSALHNLKKGDVVGVRGAFGKGFPIDNFFGNDILIVAGGLGIVPLRGLIRYIMYHRKDFGDVQILLGCKSPKEMLFNDEVSQWGRHLDILFRCTVDKADPDWKGNIGLITELIPGVTLNPMRTYAIVVGPPIMYKFVIKELLKKSIPDRQIIVSLERRMKCGLGKCGHCQINGIYVCQNGPVFRYRDIKGLEEAL